LAANAECPECGIWFHKWRVEPAQAEAIPIVDDGEPDPGQRPDALVWYGRAGVLAFVAIWGVQLAAMSYHDQSLGGSFMHNIVLPIHEAGHLIFRLFGEFMMVLGGSLFQVALPLAIGVAFYWKQRDAFGAAVCLWWAGASLVDVSPYVWDALDPQLILLGGHTGAEGFHDWVYLLGRFGAVQHAHGWGTFVHTLGVLTMIAGVAWGGWWLLRTRPLRP
jgi:hypothetical protein